MSEQKTRKSGPKRQERTLQMIKGFLKDHQNGLTIPEIAKKYNLSVTTVRNYLDQIAEENNVSRDSLLERVHPPHYMSESINRPTPRISDEEFKSKADSVQQSLDELNDAVGKSAKQIAEWPKEMEGELS